MKTFIAVVALALIASLVSGCVDAILFASATAPLRYAKPGVDYSDNNAVRERQADYYACVLADNSSWPVLDACMRAKGYETPK